MRKLVYAALAAASCALPGAVIAEPHSVHVSAQIPSMSDWTRATSENLERSLKRTNMIGISPGATAVQFNCSEDGTPATVQTVSSSGDPMLDVAARRAVRRMKSMHPLPTGIAEDQTYRAIILVAADRRDLIEQTAKLRERADLRNARLAASGNPGPVLTFAALSSLR